MSAIRRVDLGELGIVFFHTSMPFLEYVWAVDYPNGWSRRTMMDRDGRAILTRWIRPEVGE